MTINIIYNHDELNIDHNKKPDRLEINKIRHAVGYQILRDYKVDLRDKNSSGYRKKGEILSPSDFFADDDKATLDAVFIVRIGNQDRNFTPVSYTFNVEQTDNGETLLRQLNPTKIKSDIDTAGVLVVQVNNSTTNKQFRDEYRIDESETIIFESRKNDSDEA